VEKSPLGFEVERKWDYEIGYYLTCDSTRIPKALAHYELYKSIIGLAGNVIECGVYKGSSFVRFANFRQILEGEYSRKLIGFDAFGKFPYTTVAADQEFIKGFEEVGGDGISESELEEVLKYKKVENFELVKGDVCKTIPEYLLKHPELKIALLHIDVDIYEPTKAILENLYDRIVPGGLLVLDDYALIEGETRAVDEFFKGKDILIEKLPISHTPTFIRKR
jgi:hypothetical protein